MPGPKVSFWICFRCSIEPLTGVDDSSMTSSSELLVRGCKRFFFFFQRKISLLRREKDSLGIYTTSSWLYLVVRELESACGGSSSSSLACAVGRPWPVVSLPLFHSHFIRLLLLLSSSHSSASFFFAKLSDARWIDEHSKFWPAQVFLYSASSLTCKRQKPFGRKISVLCETNGASARTVDFLFLYRVIF